jgi:hypothetical protein
MGESKIKRGEQQMMKTCQVIVFPAARRVGHVNKLARLMAGYSERGGERMLNMQLARQYRARMGMSARIVRTAAALLRRSNTGQGAMNLGRFSSALRLTSNLGVEHMTKYFTTC